VVLEGTKGREAEAEAEHNKKELGRGKPRGKAPECGQIAARGNSTGMCSERFG